MTTGWIRAGFLISFFGLSLLSAHSQVASGTLAGTVLDPNRNPLPRAEVRLVKAAGTEVGRALTDGRGQFRFDGLTETSYTVTAALVGFETVSQTAQPGAALEIVLPVAPVREEVVVTATRTEAPTSQLGASTTVLTGQELETLKTLPLSDALRGVAGTAVVRSGGVGTTTSFFVRGGESDYNKVFLDGVSLNEPGGFFDFTNLMAENLERVEVVRGPQSALFGSDAMASVVQIMTRRGQSETRRPHFSFGGEGGNHDTWRARAGLSGAAGIFDYALHWARFSTDNQEPNNAFHNTSLSTNFGLRLGERTTLRLIGRGELGRTGTPGQTAFGRPDLDSFLRRRDAVAGFTLNNQTTSSWEQRVRYGFTQSRQLSRNLNIDPPFTPSFDGLTAPFPFFDFPFDFLNHTRRHQFGYQSDWRAGRVTQGAALHILTFAFEWEREQGFLGDRLFPGGEVNAQRDNRGWVLQHQLLWGRLYLTSGVRFEDNNSFGTKAVPRLSAAYYLRQRGGALGPTKLKFNLGLGIKEPSLCESFCPGPFAFGNPALRPEQARSVDAGVEQRFWSERGKLEFNWFDNRFRDLIAFEITSFVPFAGTYFNIGRTKAAGAEVVFELAPGAGLRGRGSYTFLDSRVTESGTVFDPVFEEGNRLFRRPKHSGVVQLFWDWRRLRLASTTLFVGRRTDSDFALLGLTSNKGYTRWDVSGSYRFSDHISYFGIIENLLDREYMEVLGFPALKFSVRAGAQVNF